MHRFQHANLKPNFPTVTDDERIIQTVLKGEVNAFEILIKKYQKPIYNLMQQMAQSQDKAAELTQDAFLKAYAKLETFQSGKKFFTWLYTLALNIGRDYLRQKKKPSLGLSGLPGRFHRLRSP